MVVRCVDARAWRGYARAVADEDQYLMMAMLGGLLGLGVVMLGGNAEPPHMGVLLAGVSLLLAGAYGTLFYWARGRFR
jgi:hypothetical protein